MLIYHVLDVQEEEAGVTLDLLTFDNDDERMELSYLFPNPNKAKVVTDYFSTYLGPLTVDELNEMLEDNPDKEPSHGN